MTSIMDSARRYQERFVALRRAFHAQPELACQEYQTAKRIEEELDALGIPHTRVGETGVLGVLHGREENGAVIALRADIDALPIQEETGLPYASQCPGVMHACGHDAHTTCLLGAARLLSERREMFRGEVRLIFQPAEETGGGALDFIHAGKMRGVSHVFGLHVAPDLPLGTVGMKPGLNNAAVDLFRIEIHGKSAHVSTPERGSDALYAASQIVVAIQSIVTRRSSPVEPIILGIGKLSAGTTYNAVAEYAWMEGTTRTISQETRMEMRRRIDETASLTARLSGAEAVVHWSGICSPLYNDADSCAELAQAAQALGLEVTDQRPLSLAGDNASEFLLEAPGCYAYLGTASPSLPASQIGIHNGRFDLDEEALLYGSALYAAAALHWLCP